MSPDDFSKILSGEINPVVLADDLDIDKILRTRTWMQLDKLNILVHLLANRPQFIGHEQFRGVPVNDLIVDFKALLVVAELVLANLNFEDRGALFSHIGGISSKLVDV